ncbi:MAG: hypothetical protein ACRELT_00045 [Longimicrobiales bacterium]
MANRDPTAAFADVAGLLKEMKAADRIPVRITDPLDGERVDMTFL